MSRHGALLYAVTSIVCFVFVCSTATSVDALFAHQSKSSDSNCRLVAVADLHGDIDQTRKVLEKVAKLVDSDGNWIGGCATLVQLGDTTDRHHHSIEVLDYLAMLARQAPKRGGGRVVRLLGNHCIMMLAGDFRYVSDQELASKGGVDAWRGLFSKFGKYGAMLRGLPLVHVDNASGTVFVHAGLTPRPWAALGAERINRMARVQLLDSRLSDGVFGNGGPVWDRTLIGDAMHGDCERLEESLSLLGAKRMVVGHTPQMSGRVGLFCGGKMIAADVGISQSMMKNLAAVEILRNTGVVRTLYLS